MTNILLLVLPQISAIIVFMKLSIAIAVAFLANLRTVSASSTFKVVKGFLSNSELDHFLQVKPTEEGHYNRIHGLTKIDASLVDRLKGVGAAKSVQTGHNAEIKTTHLTQSSAPHIDHVEDQEDFSWDVVEEEVSFVFLNDNPNAFFVHGEDRIPVVAGNMVIFRGGQVKHYTEVESGEVHLLGPFGARSLESVGSGGGTKASKSAKASKSKARTRAARALKVID
jgi:hypothetical protein